MTVNTRKISQINIFACGHFVAAMFLTAIFTGCGGQEGAVSEAKVPVVEDTSATENTIAQDASPTEGGANATDGNPESPPGTLELPSDYDSNEAEDGEAATGNQPGGIELPPDLEVPVDSTSAESNTQVKFATWQEIDQFAKATGRITVIDLWSLVCEPCLEEFPGLVALHQTMGDSVQCVAVDIDYDGRKNRPPEYYQQRVVDFLKSVKASGFPTYISKTPSDDVFKTTKLISIPAVMIYDASGEVVKVFVDTGEENAFTYEKDVVPFVKSLAG
jgi:thiol-disulfide isomerase/thioredoxin